MVLAMLTITALLSMALGGLGILVSVFVSEELDA